LVTLFQPSPLSSGNLVSTITTVQW